MDTKIDMYKTNKKQYVQNAYKAIPKRIHVWAIMHTRSNCGETHVSLDPKHKWASYILDPNHMQIKITFITLIGTQVEFRSHNTCLGFIKNTDIG